MMLWLGRMLAPIAGKLMAVLAILAAVAGAVAAVRRGGRDAERADVAKRTLEDIARANEAEHAVDAMSDNAVSERLRSRWGRRPQ